jgi:hypothetical protein
MSDPVVLEDFQFVAFCTAERPAYFDKAAPGAAARQLAVECFGFREVDLNPAHPGKYYGQGKYGHTFEVQVKTPIALTLASKNDKNVLNIYQ